MEGQDISSIIEDIFMNKFEEARDFKSMIKILHQKLLKNQNSSKWALSALQKFKYRLQVSDFSMLNNYFLSILQGKKPSLPNLNHLLITTPSAVKATKLSRAILLLNLKYNLNIFSVFHKIKENSCRNESKFLIPVLKQEENKKNIEKMLISLKFSLGINLQKTLDIWKFGVRLGKLNHQDQIKSIYNNEKKIIELKNLKRTKKEYTLYQKKEKELEIIRTILKHSPINEQIGFWRWKFTYQFFKAKEKKIEKACEISNNLLKHQIMSKAFKNLKFHTKPKWLLHQHIFKKALILSNTRFFYLKKYKFEKFITKNFPIEPKSARFEKSVKKIGSFDKNRKNLKLFKVISKCTKSIIKKVFTKLKLFDKSKNNIISFVQRLSKILSLHSASIFFQSLKKFCFLNNLPNKLLLKSVFQKSEIRYFYIKRQKFRHFFPQMTIMPPQNTEISVDSPLSNPRNSKNSFQGSPTHSDSSLESKPIRNQIFFPLMIYPKIRTYLKFNKFKYKSLSDISQIQLFILKNLSKIAKISIFSYFSKWKLQKNNKFPTKLFPLVTILSRIFNSKAKRVFRPPRIIKDADEIMKKTIKKLIQIKNSLFTSSIIRWRFYKNGLKFREKATILFNVFRIPKNLLTDAFFVWKEKSNARESIKRTAAIMMLSKTLNKSFRARFKLLLFKSYFKIKPKTAISRIWINFSKKYCENLRSSFCIWKAVKKSEEFRKKDMRKMRKFVNLMKIWNKNIQFRIKRGWYGLMKNSKVLKVRIFRFIANMIKLKKFNCWNLWKNILNKNDFGKYKALKMKLALQRATKKSLISGFAIFTGMISTKLGISTIFKIFFQTYRACFYNILIESKNKEIKYRITETKSLKKTQKRLKLRSSNTNKKSFLVFFKCAIQRAVKNYFDLIIPPKVSLKKENFRKIIDGLSKKPKNSFEIWKKYRIECKTKKYLEELQSIKINNLLKNMQKRVLQDHFNKVMNFGKKIQFNLRLITEIFMKNHKKVIEKWKKNTEKSKNLEILDLIRPSSLKIHLKLVHLRSLKFAFQRIFSSGDKIKGQIQIIVKKLEKKPQMALHSWKKKIDLIKETEILVAFSNEKLKNILNRVLRRALLKNFQVFIGISQNFTNVLKYIAKKITNRPKGYISKWYKTSKSLKQGKLINAFRIANLKNKFFSLTLKTLKSSFSKIISGKGLIQRFFRTFFQKKNEIRKKALNIWSKFTEKCKIGKLFDAVRTERLRNKLISINRKTLKIGLERILGDGNRIKGTVRRLLLQASKTKSQKFQIWKNWQTKIKEKELSTKIKGLQLKVYLIKCVERVSKGSLDRILGNGKRALGAIRRILTCIKLKYFNSFTCWKEKNMKLKQKDLQNAFKVSMISRKLLHNISRTLFDAIVGDIRIRRVLNRLVKNYLEIQKTAFFQIWSRVEKIRTIKKINSAYFIYKSLAIIAKKIVNFRFIFWKNLDILRKRRIIRKTIAKIIQMMSITYESGFWKWKFILSDAGTQLNPKHSMFFKRFCAIASNYQRRLCQFALFKIVLVYKSHPMNAKLSLPKALAKILKSPREYELNSSYSDSRPLSSLSVEYKKEENPSSISTIPLGSISKDEMHSISQSGALEIVFLQFKEIILRKYAWALSAIFSHCSNIGMFDTERSRLIEAISELQYEKHSLLEDNNILRIHNDSLISNLEKNTQEFQEICLEIDYLRINNMIKIISRLFEFTMLGVLNKLSVR